MGNGTENARAGWAYEVYDNKTLTKIIDQKGRVKGTQTNNRGELTAVYEALKYVASLDPTGEEIKIYSDSEITIKGLKGECNRNANKDIWHQVELLCDIINSKQLNVDVNFIESHMGSTDSKDLHNLNNEVDKLAKIASRALL